jgi:hypothetical protein
MSSVEKNEQLNKEKMEQEVKDDKEGNVKNKNYSKNNIETDEEGRQAVVEEKIVPVKLVKPTAVLSAPKVSLMKIY